MGYLGPKWQDFSGGQKGCLVGEETTLGMADFDQL